MKPFSILTLAAMFAGAICITTTAFADDATDALAAAFKAAQAAPAYRMKMSSTDPTSKAVTAMTLEVVNPDGIHMKAEGGPMGGMEMISDGKRAYMSQGGGKLTEAPIQMAEVMKQAREQFSGDAMIKMVHNAKLVGHENVNGVTASVYTFNSDMMGMHSDSKVWVSDKDHRPLKLEGESKGTMQGQQMDQKMTATYEYDPSIKITLPAS